MRVLPDSLALVVAFGLAGAPAEAKDVAAGVQATVEQVAKAPVCEIDLANTNPQWVCPPK